MSVPPPLPDPASADVRALFESAGRLVRVLGYASQHADYHLRPMCRRTADAISTAIEHEANADAEDD